MKKIFSIFSILCLLMTTQVFAQGWSYKGAFPDANFKGGGLGGHGIAVDPNGKVWIQLYGTTDSLLNAGGTYSKVRQIFVFNPDGTPASINGFKTVTIGNVTDTLFNSSRGMKADNNGNILFASFDVLYQVNYKTAAGMNKFSYPSGGGGQTLTAPAVDAAGDIFIAPVIPGNPIQILGSDFTLKGNVVDTSVGYSRTLEVSPDGNTIYWAGYTNNAVFVYNRPDEFSPYTVIDTVMKGFACESMVWNPKTHYLWASSGSAQGGLPNAYPGATTADTYPTWYAWDVSTWTIKDSINWNITNAGEDARPRGIAFSPGGDTAYVLCFGNDEYSPVQMFVNTATGVEREDNAAVKDFKLSQNYPNPFNPTTEIKFSISKAGLVTLKVYDLLGREVATLVNENLTNGNYNTKFDASNLASGTYIYRLTANGVQISKKMMLLK